MDDETVRQQVEHLEALLADVEALPEAASETAMVAVSALLELYGEGLRRIVDHVDAAGAPRVHQRLESDELVRHLLVLHDLAPAVTVDAPGDTVTPVELGPTRRNATVIKG